MRKTIWLIDDEKEMLLLLEETLSKHYNVEAFDHTEPLLDAVQSGRKPHVLVSDFRMPGLNGLQLVKKLSDMDCHAPTIIISGYIDKSVTLNELNEHVFKVLEKPFSLKDLSKTVEQALAMGHSA